MEPDGAYDLLARLFARYWGPDAPARADELAGMLAADWAALLTPWSTTPGQIEPDQRNNRAVSTPTTNATGRIGLMLRLADVAHLVASAQGFGPLRGHHTACEVTSLG